MAKQAFEKKLAGLEALRHASDPAAVRDPLRKALKDRNNYLVSKAAAIAGDRRIEELTDDLIAAFDRFFADPVKSDPQCWAKNAIAKALKDLGCRQASVFVRGIDHVQLEPVWGRRADSAQRRRPGDQEARRDRGGRAQDPGDAAGGLCHVAPSGLRMTVTGSVVLPDADVQSTAIRPAGVLMAKEGSGRPG